MTERAVDAALDAAFERWFDGLPEDTRAEARAAWDRTLEADLIRWHHATAGLRAQWRGFWRGVRIVLTGRVPPEA